MSYTYAGSLFATAESAATACAFDYLTACGFLATDEDLLDLVRKIDSDPEAIEFELESETDWTFDGDGYSLADVSMSALRALAVRELPEELKCYHCGKDVATHANGTFCAKCVDNQSAWDASDEELLERLGSHEIAEWRAAAEKAGDVSTVEDIDRAVGCCYCDALAVERTCEDCGCTALVIDCGHHAQPAAISADEHGRSLCDVCHSARVEAAEAEEAAEAATAEAREAATELDDELPAEGPSGLIARAEGNEVLLADDFASVKLTIAQARALAETLAAMRGDDPRFCSQWIWEAIAAEERRQADIAKLLVSIL